MKKFIPFCVLILMAAAMILIALHVPALLAGDFDVLILTTPLAGLASVLLLYHELTEPREQRYRSSNIVLLTISAIASVVFTVFWAFG